MNKTLLAHSALLVANLIYAINYSFAKDVMPDFIMPAGFILLRVIGALSLFALSYFSECLFEKTSEYMDNRHFEIVRTNLHYNL